MNPAPLAEVQALLRRAETILDKNYLGTKHAEMQRIIEACLQLLDTERSGREDASEMQRNRLA